jgi:predicted metal-binding membrane protein
MLVMFAVGIANLAWMAPLALIMLYEKTGSHGERAVAPIGLALLGMGTLVLLNPAWLPALVPG